MSEIALSRMGVAKLVELAKFLTCMHLRSEVPMQEDQLLQISTGEAPFCVRTEEELNLVLDVVAVVFYANEERFQHARYEMKTSMPYAHPTSDLGNACELGRLATKFDLDISVTTHRQAGENETHVYTVCAKTRLGDKTTSFSQENLPDMVILLQAIYSANSDEFD